MISSKKTLPWVLRKSVLPQHTDHAGVMWHGEYLRLLEEGRVEAIYQAGFSYKEISDLGFEMPVVSLAIDYKHPLRHGEQFVLNSWALDSKGVRWPWETNFVSNGRCIAKAKVDLVLITRKESAMKVIRKPPAQLMFFLQKLQQGPTRN